MKRVAIVLAVMGLFTAPALAEYMTPPPWDPTLPFPQTYQGWDMPTQLTGLSDGTVLDAPPYNPMPPLDDGNPFGYPVIEWPNGLYDIEIVIDEETGETEWVTVEATTTVDLVCYEDPEGGIHDGTPTVHIGVTDPGTGDEVSGVPVPVSIWIPNNPDENLVKKLWWQMTSDKSPTPLGDPPTTDPPGTPDPSQSTSIQHGSSTWYTYGGYTEIIPNPDGEWLTFELVDSTNIEEINVDTICMPEPATLGLMALGGMGILLGRRRRR